MDPGKHKSPLNVEEGVEEFESERYNVTKTHPDNVALKIGKGHKPAMQAAFRNWTR